MTQSGKSRGPRIAAAVLAIGTVALVLFLALRPRQKIDKAEPSQEPDPTPVAQQTTAAAPLAAFPGAKAPPPPPPAECGACESYGWTTLKLDICNPKVSDCKDFPLDDQALCQSAISCIRKSGCATDDQGDIQPCYCGKGVKDEACLSGQAKGDCKAEIEAAAKSDDPVTLANRFAHVGYPISRVAYKFRCDADACKDKCTF